MATATRRPPHVLLFVIDDLPWTMFPHEGNLSGAVGQLMPNLAALVDNGLSLRRYYTYPLCSPARASLLTGRFPSRAYHELHHGQTACKGVSPGFTLLAEKLKYEAGYRTHMIVRSRAALEEPRHPLPLPSPSEALAQPSPIPSTCPRAACRVSGMWVVSHWPVRRAG